MALILLIAVLLFVVALIVAFVFPPTRWVEWFYGDGESKK